MTTVNLSANTPVGEIAAAAPLATRVFARHGIDFCCGGGVPLSQACAKRDLIVDTVLEEIQKEIADAPNDVRSWAEAPLPELIEHILTVYHRPLDEELPRIEAMARKVNAVHGDKAPEMLGGILETFVALKNELQSHMMKEEQILFPMIVSGRGGMAMGPISVMRHEHDDAGTMLGKLRDLTNNYEVPDGACNTWRALWHGLADLERSLHEHIHLENNILFPRALGA